MDPKELSGLATDILKLSPERAAAQIDALSPEARVELVLSLPSGRQRMELILQSSRPEELVRALPPEDLVLTIKDIGDQDAVPLLDLSSDPQLKYLLDLELWIQEGMDLNRLAHWLQILFECGDQRTLRWARSVDFELLVLMLERTVLAVDRDELENMPELLTARLYTPDDTHFLLIKLGAEFTLLKQFLDLLYSSELDMFLALLGNLGTTPLAELEDLALKWRNGRLSDRGWPNLDEALELYQPIDPTEAGPVKEMPFGLENPPRYPLQLFYKSRLLSEGIGKLPGEDERARVASQLANLINRVVIGDGLIPGETSSLGRAAERVKGRLEIGLALSGALDAQTSANLLGQRSLLWIFRLAQGAIIDRVERARRLRSSLGGLWSLMRSPLQERFDVLLSPRPMFLPADASLPVEFSDIQDLFMLDKDLELAEVTAAVCRALRLRKSSLPDPFPERTHPDSVEGLSIDALVLTAFARATVGLAPAPEPFPAERLAELYGALPRESDSRQASIRDWTGKLLESRPAGLDAFCRNLTRLMMDFLAHDPGKIDPRFVEGLWVRIPD